MNRLDTLSPYTLSIDQVISQHKTSANEGLTEVEAKQRLSAYGYNKLEEKSRRSAWSILFSQLKEIIVLILLAASLLSFVLQEPLDGMVILVILLLNTLLGFWQEYNAEKSMQALQELAVPEVRTLRDSTEQKISAELLVPGDIVILEAGNLLPADGRLIDCSNLKIQEAALTGESEPIEKNTEALMSENSPLGDRKNMAYMGTVVNYGRGTLCVTATGMHTELGKIASMLQNVQEEKTPLQKRLGLLGKKLALMALGLIVLVVILSLIRIKVWEHFNWEAFKEIFMTAVSMAVAAIPEGLPVLVTIALALGAKKMLKRQSLIRRLPAVETLGSVTVICSDKTGTLTQNRMTVTQAILPDQPFSQEDLKLKANPNLNLLLNAAALCNDAQLTGDEQKGLGDPTEIALVQAALTAGWPKSALEQHLPRQAELPFDSERKRMTTVHLVQDQEDSPPFLKALLKEKEKPTYLAFTKGSVDGMLAVCNRILKEDTVYDLDTAERDKIIQKNKELAEQGVRVLGAALKIADKSTLNNPDSSENELIYIGMIGMTDPVRPEAIQAVKTCEKAGIRPVMITGDHPLTALAVAKKLGMHTKERFLTGQDLSSMSLAALRKKVTEVAVYARVSPEHKMKIIDALQDKSEIVSMTGDGVNDAPALKSADIGVAMGITGTDVAKESADMVLLDDNFATIVKAVKEGRTIYNNIKKFITYILTGNLGEILVMLFGPLLGLPLPLIPIQILWINLVTDGLPAIALGYEPSDKKIMHRKPIPPGEGIFAQGVGLRILSTGILVGLLSLIVGVYFHRQGFPLAVWRTMVFTSLTFCQMAYALCIRAESRSLFGLNPFTNPAMVIGILSTLGLQFLLIYHPLFQSIFRTAALSRAQLGICGLCALVIVLTSELKKAASYFKSRQ